MLQSILSFVMAWYNLPFTILLAVCLLLIVMQWSGLGGEQEDGVEAEAEAHVDAAHVDAAHVDAAHDYAEADADAEADHEVEQSASHDHATGSPAASGHGFSILAYLGFGRAPLLIILLLLFGSVGVLGWLLNGLVTRTLGVYPGLMFGIVFAGSLTGGSLVSARIARWIGKALPPVSTTATSAQAIVGRSGTVTSPYVDQRYGMVHLRDSGGTLISVFAITQEEPPIRRGETVLFVQYDPTRRQYEVVRSES